MLDGFCVRLGVSDGVCLCDGGCEGLCVTLGFVAALAWCPAEVLDGTSFRLGDSESSGGRISSTLELVAALAWGAAEVLDGCCVGLGNWCGDGVDGGNGQEGGGDDGEDLHLDGFDLVSCLIL